MQQILFMVSKDAQYKLYHFEYHAGSYDKQCRNVVVSTEKVHAESDGC